MTKLNQIIAIANGEKGRSQKAISEIYHKVQKPELLRGISRTYQPLDDDGERFPNESKQVVYSVPQAIEEFEEAVSRMHHIVLTQDKANCEAKADIVVDDETLMADVPVTSLLFLEKQVTDLSTFIGSLPVLDPSEKWSFDDSVNHYATESKSTVKTKKIPRNHLKSPATPEHPAQVEIFTEDVVVGNWSTVNFSGAIPAKDKQEMVDRCRLLLNAIKAAREEANCIQVPDLPKDSPLLEFVFGSSV